jgi:hypothetical protein
MPREPLQWYDHDAEGMAAFKLIDRRRPRVVFLPFRRQNDSTG